jgi:4-hydroxy 2-oxovalerate aldolase
MGRGPGNAQTENMLVELARLTGQSIKLAPLLDLISRHFGPMKAKYGWGQNPFYHLAGQYGIHPTFVQAMLSDARYSDEDVLSVIEHLRGRGGKKYIESELEQGRQRFGSAALGTWRPAEQLEGRVVLIIGAGQSASANREELEQYIRECRPFVVALNTQSALDIELINIRVACHPVRLVADCDTYRRLAQPLVVPVNSLDPLVRESLSTIQLYNFGLSIQPNTFRFEDDYAVVPTSMVLAYALAMCVSGRAQRILLAGFDGYGHGDPRNSEMEELISLYQSSETSLPLLSITPTVYPIPSTSIYAL